jgi:hypothetical protein
MKQRYETRRRAGVHVEMISSRCRETLDVFTADLSPRGAYVVSPLVPAVGDHLVCCFSLGEKPREYLFFGEVTRVNLGRRRGDEGPIGFGVRFLDATPFERLLIRSELQGVPPPTPTRPREEMPARAHGFV